jgi:hypothetical protein
MNNSHKYQSRVKDIFSSAKIFHSNHQYIIDRMNKSVFEEKGYRNLTTYRRGEIMGMYNLLFEQIYKDLDFRYFLDGKWIIAKQLTSEQMRAINNETLCGHFWVNTDKSWSISKLGE